MTAIVVAAVGFVMAGCVLLTAALQNRTADITDYVIVRGELPTEFSGMVIAQISDYHGDDTCREQILQSLREREPDAIAITGDLFDPGVEKESLSFSAQLASIAPVYYVTGNHEARMENYPELEKEMRALGVNVLRNEKMCISRGEESITIAGADDRDMGEQPDYEALCADEGFTLLLAHRPEEIKAYAAAGADVVLVGHAHGGQFRIPGLQQGILAPGQGLLPKYTQGVFMLKDTMMVISRGIANLYFPPRLFNPPELVYVTLYGEN